MKKAVFLDRDGIINVDKGYVYKIEDFEFVKGIIDILQHLSNKNYLLFIITNQSGIARGYYKIEDYEKLTKYYLNKLKENNIKITEIKYCPHHPQGIIPEYTKECSHRKPQSEMISDLIKKYNIDKSESYLIGDSERDIIAGNKENLKTILLIKNNNINTNAEIVINDLEEVLKII